MKKSLNAILLMASCAFSTASFAVPCPPAEKGSTDPGVFFGITYAFGSKEGLGFTLQVTSSRRDDRGVAAAGVSYYPTTGTIGVPLSLGYQKSHVLVLGGYDFLLNAPVIQGGYTNTSKDKTPVCLT